MDQAYIHSTVEALVLASPEPLPARKITQVIDDLTSSGVTRTVADLNERYAAAGTSFRIREIAGGYQFYILPEYVGFVEELFTRHRKLRLTRAALETIAIVAYRQPVTKTEIEHVRGVASDGVLHNLLDKKLVTITGRAATVGKPLQYGTTDEFLKFFGLNSLDDLPRMSEIEELVAASEPQNQTELRLDEAVEAMQEKLNVADGTYDPQEREQIDEEQAAETAAQSGTPQGKLVLRRQSPEETREDETTIERVAEAAPDTRTAVGGES